VVRDLSLQSASSFPVVLIVASRGGCDAIEPALFGI
jgi:hypothetical protein